MTDKQIMEKVEEAMELGRKQGRAEALGETVIPLSNLSEHDKKIKADLIEEIIDKIMQEDYCDKSCCCDYERDCRVNCEKYRHNISAIIGMLINMRVKEKKNE